MDKNISDLLKKYKWSDGKVTIHELFEAINIVKTMRKATATLLQRRQWIGFARACFLIDTMEEMELVWPFNWSKPRKVYLKNFF